MRSRPSLQPTRFGTCRSRISGSTRAWRRFVTSSLVTGEIEEILELGHGVLSVAIREDGCPRGSNARVQARHLQVVEWVQGEIVRITGYLDADEARAAAERRAEERG